MRFLWLLLIASTFALAQSDAPANTAQAGMPVDKENALKARSLLDQAIQALGGDAYLQIKDITQQGRTYSFHHGEPTSYGIVFWRFYKYPDKERVEVTKQRDVVYINNGDNGYEITYKGTRVQEAKDLADINRRRQYALDWVLKHWLNEPGIALFYEGNAVAAEKPAQQITILNSKNQGVTLYLDNDTHLPLKKSFSWRDPTDRERNVEEELYDAYRPVQGIMTPFSVTRFYNGDMAGQRFINTVSYNEGISDSKFDAKATYVANPSGPKK